MASNSDSSELGSTAYELFIGALSVLSLVNVVLVIVLRHAGARNVVLTVDVLGDEPAGAVRFVAQRRRRV
jgi:hypothetical protein